MKQIKIPKDFRIGQTIFGFLEFLAQKGYPTNQSYRLADTFHIDDEELAKLYNEFINELL